jgi:transposase-like protein
MNKDIKPIYKDAINESISNTSDIELKKKLHSNFGNKWSEEEKNELLAMIRESGNELDIEGIAKKLGRSQGGIKAEIKKMIVEKYLQGDDTNKISKELNLEFRYVKNILKYYFEKESEIDAKALESENKLIKLKIDNIKLRKELKDIMKNL